MEPPREQHAGKAERDPREAAGDIGGAEIRLAPRGPSWQPSLLDAADAEAVAMWRRRDGGAGLLRPPIAPRVEVPCPVITLCLLQDC
jgi:hypothetical protein